MQGIHLTSRNYVQRLCCLCHQFVRSHSRVDYEEWWGIFEECISRYIILLSNWDKEPTSIVISRVGSGEGNPFLLFNGGRLGKLPAVAHNKPTEQPYARSAVHTMVREDLKVFWIFSCIDLHQMKSHKFGTVGLKQEWAVWDMSVTAASGICLENRPGRLSPWLHT